MQVLLTRAVRDTADENFPAQHATTDEQMAQDLAATNCDVDFASERRSLCLCALGRRAVVGRGLRRRRGRSSRGGSSRLLSRRRSGRGSVVRKRFQAGGLISLHRGGVISRLCRCRRGLSSVGFVRGGAHSGKKNRFCASTGPFHADLSENSNTNNEYTSKDSTKRGKSQQTVAPKPKRTTARALSHSFR